MSDCHAPCLNGQHSGTVYQNVPKIAIITVVMAITNKPSTTQATYFDTTSFYPGFKLYYSLYSVFLDPTGSLAFTLLVS